MRTLKSIRVQLVAIVLLCYLIPTLLLGQYMGNIFFSDLRSKTEAALTTGAEHAFSSCVQSVEQLLALARDATYDGELTNVDSRYTSGQMSETEYLRQSRNYLERKYSRESLLTVAVYFPVNAPEQLMYSRSGYEQAILFQRSFQSRTLELGEKLDTRCLFVQNGDDLYLIRNLLNLRMERYGMLVLGVDRQQLFAPLTSLAEAWEGEAEIVLGPAEDAAEEDGTPRLQSSGEHVLFTQSVRQWDYSLSLRMSIPENRLYGEIHFFRRLMTALLLLLIPLLLAMLSYVRLKLVQPITQLANAARRIEMGELGVTVSIPGGDELSGLGRAFSNMSTQIAHLVDKTYKEEIMLRDAQIQAMQSRLNPHFINNALEMINWEARIEGSEKISGMVEALSVLLNASMARGDRRMIPLREEIEIARAYFYLVRLRFGDRLTICIQADEALLDFTVPQLTIQPLLENAVEHGVAPAGGGRIDLTCSLSGAKLVIRVANTGHAITEDDRARIDQALKGDSAGGSHLGIASISRRLRLIYHDEAQMTITTHDQQTVARLEIPAEQYTTSGGGL